MQLQRTFCNVRQAQFVLAVSSKWGKMKIKTLDGFIAEGENAEEVCKALWHSMIFADADFQTWMVNSAKRAKMWNGAIVRADSAENHLADLIANNVIRLLDD